MLAEVESLTIDYFELNGFLVRKGWNNAEAEGVFPSLVVRNLKEDLEETMMFNFQWFSSDVMKTQRAVVCFVAEDLLLEGKTILKQDKRLFQSLKKVITAKQALKFPWEVKSLKERDLQGHKKLVLFPAIPTSDPQRSNLIDLLQKKEVDGVITFRTLLDNMIQQLDTLESPQLTSRLRQLKILKQMELIKMSQMDLFTS